MTNEQSHKALIKKHLLNGGSITALEALKEFGCYRLASRISDLREEGLIIKKTMEESISVVTGKPVRFARYSLEKKAQRPKRVNPNSLDMEIWKDIKGYTGRYKVSNMGNVKSYVSRHRVYSEKVLKQSKNNMGYLSVGLYGSSGKVRRFYVHRLVAMAFIGILPHGHEVNHKNGNKTDNRVENLEIITSSENQRHAYRMGLQRPTTNNGKSVSAFLFGKPVGTFTSVSDMCRRLSLNRVTVWKVMNGQFSQHHGYTFKFNN